MGIAVFADKFSGTLSSNEVINEVNKIFKYNNIKASFFPVTDGGEGSTEIFKQYGFKTNENLMLQDFTGKWIPVETLTINKHIYLETSQLIGINNSEINTLDLNSSCIAKIIDNVDVLSMGGSKTNDAGIGLLSKMGIDFLKNDEIIKDPKPRDFELINNVNVNEDFKTLNKKILIDTTIPLLGEKNAFKIFGPQKGLKKSEIKSIEKNIERIFDLLEKELEVKFNPYKEGTGASGGLSFALSEVLGCEIVSGSDFFLNETKVNKKIKKFENLILCEGKFDFSSMNGKVLGEILKLHTGSAYFLGGKFDYNDESVFKDVFELGNKGMKDSKKELRNATYKLAKKMKS